MSQSKMTDGSAKPIQVQLISGPDSWGFDGMIEAALKNAGFEVTLVNVDSYLKTKDWAAVGSLLNRSADATVVVSALRWNNLAGMVEPSALPNGITLTANRAASILEAYQPRFVLDRPIQVDELQPLIRAVTLLTSPAGKSWQEFERYAREYMGFHTGVEFRPGSVGRVPKRFDMVWENGRIVGDAKFLTLVRGKKPAPAKFMEIAGHVWLLQATKANRSFLVFGNDKRVPEMWLEKYERLVERVEFYFLADYGQLMKLK